jgi:hypothetical protein
LSFSLPLSLFRLFPIFSPFPSLCNSVLPLGHQSLSLYWVRAF